MNRYLRVLVLESYFKNVFEQAKLLFQIGGIGKVTEHILKDALGINTCEEMLQKGGHLCALFSQSSAGRCYNISHRYYIMNT